jgi:hypothetical protein
MNNDTKKDRKKPERFKMSKAEVVSTVLNVVERRSLEKLEKVIESGVESFLATGSALKQIRDDKLYREGHKTFESYVKQKWSIETRQAYRLIDASDVKADLCPIGQKITKANEIKTEGQLRELTSVPHESLEDVVKKAAEIAGDAPLTAKVLKEAREQVLEPEKLEEPTAEEPACEDVEPEPEPEPEPVGPLDCVGWFKEQIGLVNELVRNMDTVVEVPGNELLMSRRLSIRREIEHIKGSFRAVMPHAICPRCHGDCCTQCGNMGWVNKQRFDELKG